MQAMNNINSMTDPAARLAAVEAFTHALTGR